MTLSSGVIWQLAVAGRIGDSDVVVLVAQDRPAATNACYGMGAVDDESHLPPRLVPVGQPAEDPEGGSDHEWERHLALA